MSLRLAFTFAFSTPAAITTATRLALFLLALLFRRGLRLLFLMLRPVAYSFSLRLSLALGLLLSPGRILLSSNRSLLRSSIVSLLLPLSTSIFSYLLLQLTCLALSFAISFCGFGIKPVYFMLASAVRFPVPVLV